MAKKTRKSRSDSARQSPRKAKAAKRPSRSSKPTGRKTARPAKKKAKPPRKAKPKAKSKPAKARPKAKSGPAKARPKAKPTLPKKPVQHHQRQPAPTLTRLRRILPEAAGQRATRLPPMVPEHRRPPIDEMDEQLAAGGVDLDRLRAMVERLTGDIDPDDRKS